MKVVRLLAIGSFLAGVGGCGHVPVSTIYKLWSFDAATADPAVLRAAVQFPQMLSPRPGGVVLTFSSWAEGEADHHAHEFVLEEARELAERAPLARFQRPGTTLAAYRLSAADVAEVRRLQGQHRDRKRMSAVKVNGEITVKADACRRGPLPIGPIVTTTFLKVSASEGYMPLLDNVDLRAELGDAALSQHLPPCEAH